MYYWSLKLLLEQCWNDEKKDILNVREKNGGNVGKWGVFWASAKDKKLNQRGKSNA